MAMCVPCSVGMAPDPRRCDGTTPWLPIESRELEPCDRWALAWPASLTLARRGPICFGSRLVLASGRTSQCRWLCPGGGWRACREEGVESNALLTMVLASFSRCKTMHDDCALPWWY